MKELEKRIATEGWRERKKITELKRYEIIPLYLITVRKGRKKQERGRKMKTMIRDRVEGGQLNRTTGNMQ